MTGKPAAKEGCAHPRLKARFGEDPFRFLSMSPPEARVKGLRSSTLLQLYIRIEERAFGGRRRVLRAAGQRQATLAQQADEIDNEPATAVATDGGVDQ